MFSGRATSTRYVVRAVWAGKSGKRTSSMVGLAKATKMVRSRRTWGIRATQATRAMTEYVRRLQNGRPISRASALSDRQLNDIGLTSAEFRWAARQPLHIDARGEFACLSCERRSGRGQRTA